MEALALLCTLHADGPSSLRRLRRAGCSSLQHLERMPAEDLAEILEVPPAVARRLGREARGLTSRLDLGPFEDQEEAPQLGTPAGFTPPAPGGDLDRRERALLERVVGRWKAEEISPASIPARAPVPELPPLFMDPPEADAPSEPAGGVHAGTEDLEELAGTVEQRPGVDVTPTPEVVGPAPSFVSPAATALQAGDVPGLDRGLAAALNEHGITDLASLAKIDAVSVARAIGVPFTALRRVQFLAKRATSEAPRAAATPTTPEPPRPIVMKAPAARLVEEADGERPIVELPVAGLEPVDLAPMDLEPMVTHPASRPSSATNFEVPVDQRLSVPDESSDLVSTTRMRRPAVECVVPLPTGTLPERTLVRTPEVARHAVLPGLAEPTPPAVAEQAKPKPVRKFWEPLPQWAADLEPKDIEQPIPLPPEEPTPPAGSHPRSRRRGRSLNWTFEVPGQKSASTPTQPPTVPYSLDSSFGPGLGPVAQRPDAPAEDEGPAGPFA